MRAAAALAAMLAFSVIAATPAEAAPTTEVVQGRYLRLVSTADWTQALRLTPGNPVRWDIEISAAAPDPGTVSVGMSASGDTVLLVDVRLCARAWQGEECPGGADALRTDWEVPRDGAVAALTTFADDAVAHLRLDVRLGAAGAIGTAGPAPTELRVHADGMGDGVSVGPGLPGTGGAIPYPIIIGGGALLAVGTVVVIATAVRRRRGDEDDGGDA
ncbi:hypothetical protein GCM10025768_08250 [Microbacterium pseudoresistens]